VAPTEKQLLQGCEDLGLCSTGTVAQLSERIDSYKISQEISTKDAEDPMCDAILVTQSIFGSDEDMKLGAKEAFEHELEKEELEIEHVSGETFVGNRRGLDLANIKAKINILEARDKDRGDEINDLRRVTKDLRARVSVLSLASQDYKRVRHRKISTFKRDNFPDEMEDSDYDIIREVNVIVHEGDAAVDALLYEGEGRRDGYIFQQLYGLHPADVRTIMHPETLAILNAHAEVRDHRQKSGTDEFYEKFAEFILALQKSNLNTNCLIGESANPTRTAYWALLKCQRYKNNE